MALLIHPIVMNVHTWIFMTDRVAPKLLLCFGLSITYRLTYSKTLKVPSQCRLRHRLQSFPDTFNFGISSPRFPMKSRSSQKSIQLELFIFDPNGWILMYSKFRYWCGMPKYPQILILCKTKFWKETHKLCFNITSRINQS